jgi:pimeloyl-ACP methyl ester carboxylesterase
MEQLELRANGIRFAALAAGPEDGRLVLMLHGFPELARSWRHQLPALATAGFRAVAPDLRGYGATERCGPYDVGTLAGDAAALVGALGRDRAVLAGHDWGGAIAWAAVHRYPDRFERLVILNAPHPALMREELRASGEQRRRSRYMFLFQLPWLPERLLSRDRGRMVARALRGGSHARNAWSDDELERYRRAFSRPSDLAGPLAYYRTAFRRALLRRSFPLGDPIDVPVLVLWGVHDRFLGPALADEARLRRYAPDLRVVPIEEAGHFVQNEAPERVNRELLAWLP